VTYKKREGKPDYSLVDRSMLDPAVEAMTYGKGKHGRDNYLINPDVTDDELIAAARRHALEDPSSVDEDSGCLHGGCAMANFMMYFRRQAAREAKAPTEPVADQCTPTALASKRCKTCGDRVEFDSGNWFHVPAHNYLYACQWAQVD
jgi:hypothetical protein